MTVIILMPPMKSSKVSFLSFFLKDGLDLTPDDDLQPDDEN